MPSNPSIHSKSHVLIGKYGEELEDRYTEFLEQDHITLRDLFAGFCLAGILCSGAEVGMDVELASKWSYSHADAMLEQRQAKEDS